MLESPRSLCRRYSYPKALEEVLSELTDRARASIPGLHSFVVSGSVATGDFAWREEPAGVRFLSDVDAFLFVDGRPGRAPEFDATVERLERTHGSPLFHIDTSISPVSALRRLPRTYQFVETGMAGVVLAGRDVLPRFPTRFEPRATRQAAIGNFWKGVLCWPDVGGGSEEVYLQSLARIVLDTPILALAAQGRCIPGHRARAEAFLGLGDDHPLVCESSRKAVALAVRARQGEEVRRAALEPLILPLIDRVFDFLDGCGPPPRDPDRALVRRIRRLLPPRTPRLLAGELRSVLRSPRGPVRDVGWLLRRKEAVGGAALLGLLAFALSGARGEPPGGITARLREFTGGSAPSGSGRAFLTEARRVYWAGCCRLYPSAQLKDAFYRRLLRAEPDGGT
jgi:hypothetical protein